MNWTEIKEKAAPVDVFWRKKGLTSCTDARDRDIGLASGNALLGMGIRHKYGAEGVFIHQTDIDRWREEITHA